MTSAAITKLRATIAEFERWRKRDAKDGRSGMRLSDPNWERLLAEMAAVIAEAEREKAADIERTIEAFKRGAGAMQTAIVRMLQGKLHGQNNRARGRGTTDYERLSAGQQARAEEAGMVLAGAIKQAEQTQVWVPSEFGSASLTEPMADTSEGSSGRHPQPGARA